MPDVIIRTTSTWRTKFMRLESAFFSIPPAEWRSSLGKKVKHLGLSYQPRVHQFHITLLNTRMRLSPQLRTSHFTGDTRLSAVRELVRQRIPNDDAELSVPLPSGASLSSMGLSHLDTSESKK